MILIFIVSLWGLFVNIVWRGGALDRCLPSASVLKRPLLVGIVGFGRFKLEDFTAVDEVWLIGEAVLELPKGGRFLW